MRAGHALWGANAVPECYERLGLTTARALQMGRHGSRYPLSSELVFITDLVAKLGNASAAVQKARLPSSLAFLKGGYTSTLGHDDLTAPGRLQLFKHGVECVSRFASDSM